jgi:hypothetical protein
MTMPFITTKKIFALVTIFSILISDPVEAQTKKAKPSAESIPNDEALIKSVIEKETKAFFEIDQKTWMGYWGHVPYAFWSFADTTDVNSFSGWNDINAGFDNYFKTSKPSTAKIQRDWHHITIRGDLAYIRFTQHVRGEIMRPPQAELRVMEKINGEWKIICVSVIAIQKDNIPVR